MMLVLFHNIDRRDIEKMSSKINYYILLLFEIIISSLNAILNDSLLNQLQSEL